MAIKQAPTVKNILKHKKGVHKLPLTMGKVAAGFPSPAEEYIQDSLSLDEHLVPHPMQATHKDIVIAVVSGELTVKRLMKVENGWQLHAENPNYKPIIVKNDEELSVWGVVTYVVHKTS
jgi:DNA polymerase V